MWRKIRTLPSLGQSERSRGPDFFDGGAKANFIAPELVARLEITPDWMGPLVEAVLAAPGMDVAITSVIGKLRLHCQGYLEHEDFSIMPLEGCDVLLGIPWYHKNNAVVDYRARKATLTTEKGKTIVLAEVRVCPDCNICRSPTAEAVFRYFVEKRGLEVQFNIDSAGTIDYHEGEPADARMKTAASKRGVKLTSISRPIRPSDFEEFDIILAMDRKNKEDILKAHRHWSTTQTLPPGSEKKVKLICEYCKKFDVTEVPDPYYGGAAGFEKVLDLLEDACESLLDSLVMPNKGLKKNSG
ncbi:hypothetical protein L7F22_066116 [Adiantum nelumboides]|nr:hypothetical protein [Adiantum nelumboides]